MRTALLLALTITLGACGNDDKDGGGGSDGPATAEMPVPQQNGTAAAGREVFRFETFGNEKFWTDAVRLPAGMVAAGFTPLKALGTGLHIDSDAIEPTLRAALAAELKTDLSPGNAPLLNDVNTTVKLVNQNAVIGLTPKDSDGNGVIDVAAGDKVGATCALCHTITDASVYNMTNGGSIGGRQDGRATHVLNFGALVALGTNSRALFPILQLALDANGGKTLGRSPTGLTDKSTEAEVDAYLSNPAFYPIGMFDDTPDGNGDPMHNSPLFRQDLAGPFGTEGAIGRLDNFSNLVYTALLDPTNLTTAGGRAFLRKLGGAAAGDEIVHKYIAVLAETGVTGYPYVAAAPHPQPGSEDAPLGNRVDDTKLKDMNAYLVSLQAPRGLVADASAVGRGRELFRTSTCTQCHNVEQAKFVPPFIVPMKTIFPGDNPAVLLAMRDPPLNPILNTVDSIFDDKMAVVNASLRGRERGTAMPLLLDLARKPNFLHDNSVPTMESLLSPSRGPNAPHPFYFSDPGEVSDMTAFLRSLDTGN